MIKTDSTNPAAPAPLNARKAPRLCVIEQGRRNGSGATVEDGICVAATAKNRRKVIRSLGGLLRLHHDWSVQDGDSIPAPVDPAGRAAEEARVHTQFAEDGMGDNQYELVWVKPRPFKKRRGKLAKQLSGKTTN